MSSSRLRALLSVTSLGLATAAAHAAVDLASLRVVPERGQNADAARRDRYECHQWAVEQSGTLPAAAPTEQDAERARAERTEHVVAGAATGAAIGGLVRAVQNKNPAHGMLAGAALGAVVGAATSRPADSGAAAPDPASDPYLRALSACLEGRGYRLEFPDGSAADADR
jgi:uncharacterized protein YfiM (DUF2279 family)